MGKLAREITVADEITRYAVELCMRTHVRDVTIRESVLRCYEQKVSEFLESIRRYCVENGLGCTISPTAVPFDELILRMMREAGSVR